MSTSPPETRLRLRGPLTIGGCERLHEELGAALKRGSRIVVEIDPDEETDLSFLQLLIAAQRSAACSGRGITLHAPPAGRLAAALASCGFSTAPGATALEDIFSS